MVISSSFNATGIYRVVEKCQMNKIVFEFTSVNKVFNIFYYLSCNYEDFRL